MQRWLKTRQNYNKKLIKESIFSKFVDRHVTILLKDVSHTSQTRCEENA